MTPLKSKLIRCAVVGYGPTFDFGRAHARWMERVEGLQVVAVCDRDPARLEQARADLPGIATYTELEDLLVSDVDLVAVVVPHHAHAPVVLACLRAGKHVVVDKPMALTVAEATAMIDAAEQAGVTLAVFHNRRHDGNYRAIRGTVASGTIGDVFHVEVTAGGYGHPGHSWRSSREVSGGALYDWGAHAIDWVLTLIPSRATGVTGFAHKLVWEDVTNEDQARAILHFENGAVADVCISSIAAAGKPLWRILGTQGAIVDTGEHSLTGYYPEYAAEKQSEGHFQLIIVCDGRRQETTVPYALSTWGRYYEDLAAHLRHGGPVPVSGQDGRRVIAVLETAQRSAASGRTELIGLPEI